jgi:transcriptional regulator with GAF, ATPase, and Fis domain
VPLVVLSIVLAQVLERGHASDQTEGMQTIVRSTMEQLNEQMDRLRGSAATWLGDLTQVLALEIGDAPSGDVAQRFDAARPALQQLLSGQLPPEWRGGSLRLDWNSSADPAGRADDLRTVVAGDVRMAATEAPARLEPGVYVQWGTVVIAVRSEAPVRGGVLALTVARPLGADFLSALAPGQSLMLCDTRGYPLEVAGSRIPQQSVLQYGRLPAVMKKRERALLSSLDRSAPVVDRATSVYGDWISGYAVLRDLQDTPRALLVLTQPNQRATLDLPIGRIPVRAFFFLVAGLLIVLSAFLSFVISRRISRPVELLEHSALSLARGELKTRVPVEERGQLGRVSRAFNRMAADLEGRLFDLQKLNRVMRDLSSQLDANHTLQVLRGFCEQHGAVDRVRIALLEPETGLVELHGGAEIERFDSPAELRFLPRASGPFCLCWPDGKAQQSELLNRLPGVRSVVGLPLLVGGRCRGAVLLLFENAQPGETDLDLLATVAAQAAIALDNAQLYQHAVQDPVTGAYVPDYFRRRTAEEVALAQQRGVPLALVGVGLGDDLGRPQDLRRLAALLRDLGPPGALLCHAGAGRFHWLLPGVDRQKAQQTIERVHAQWRQEQTVSTDDAEARPLVVAVVVFPDEAASSEFLFSAMADQLERRTVSTTLPTEVDDAMVVEGVTATSPAMRGVLRTLRRVAPTDLAVLILGETGSGKEVLTNLVHRWSRRAEGPLVKVNCAALSPALLQSELFGHEKGAFTGADRRKIGKFEQANGGTILLDEVGEIPLDVQVQLLRVLQEREVDRVGGIDPVPIDVRVVAATNRDIERMVEEGRFREDLYYRLQGIVVNVPPLRQRKPEIPALVENFRREVEASGQSRVRAFSTDAMDELFRYDWPGNVRELRNSVHRAMVLAAGEVVERRDVLASLPRGKSVYPLDLTTSMAMPAQQAEQPPQRHRERSGGEGAGSGVPGPDAPAGHSAAAGAGAAKGAGRRPSGVGKPRSGEVGAAQARAGESAATDATAGNGKATDGNVPEVVLPRAAVHDPLAALPERVRLLLERLRERGEISTQEHMAASGVSHRTGLRDLQALVDLGLAERVGSRRGARYRLVIGRPAGGTA